jgi:hypothetical protein
VPLFLRKIFPGSCSKNQQKLRGSQCLRLPQPSCYTRFMPNKGHKTGCAMTRRDFGMLCNSTPQTALRGIAQPYRFWGLKIFTPLKLRFQDFQRKWFIFYLTNFAVLPELSW